MPVQNHDNPMTDERDDIQSLTVLQELRGSVLFYVDPLESLR